MNLACHRNTGVCTVCLRSRNRWAAGITLAPSTVCPPLCDTHCPGRMTNFLSVLVGFVDSWAGMALASGGTAGLKDKCGSEGAEIRGWDGRRTGFPLEGWEQKATQT